MTAGYSAAQVRAAEAPHLAAGEPLMAMAAAGLADEIRDVLADRRADGLTPGPRARVLVLVGPGNNGGDALFAAATLARAADVALLPVHARIHEAGLAAALGAGAVTVPPEDALEAAASSDVVVDGMFGTGSAGRSPVLRGTARKVVEAILPLLAGPRGPVVVAVDIPSGIDADDGGVPDPVVLPADVTVTFGGIKAGLLLAPASELAGRLVLVDIGLGPDLAAMKPLVDRGADR